MNPSRFSLVAADALARPGEFRKFIDAELNKWAQVVKAANVKPE